LRTTQTAISECVAAPEVGSIPHSQPRIRESASRWTCNVLNRERRTEFAKRDSLALDLALDKPTSCNPILAQNT
jgi:hypothetical protein